MLPMQTISHARVLQVSCILRYACQVSNQVFSIYHGFNTSCCLILFCHTTIEKKIHKTNQRKLLTQLRVLHTDQCCTHTKTLATRDCSWDVLLVLFPLFVDYTMVNFVKPNLLGTAKEFYNRFINPITNGQCRDSRPEDVRLMKQRAHVLYELLQGCVDVSGLLANSMMHFA